MQRSLISRSLWSQSSAAGRIVTFRNLLNSGSFRLLSSKPQNVKLVQVARSARLVRSNNAPRRKFSSAKESSKQAEGEAGEAAGEQGEIPQDTHVPLIGKIGAGVKVLFTFALGGAIVALIGYGGYYIISSIAPTSSSPLSIRNAAAKLLEANPEVGSSFGEIHRVRGMDMGGRGEGRRNYVPSYTYEAEGKKYTRIKFQVDNERKQSGTVFAEVEHGRSSADVFNYLMVQTHTGRVIVIQDHRKPEKPKDLRKYDVCIKLQNESARFYHGGPDHVSSRQQEQILSPHFDYVKLIRCDRDEARCEADGVSPGTLVYRNQQIKAPISLDDLEKAVGLSRYTRPGGVSYQDATEDHH